MPARLIVAAENLRSYPKGGIICLLVGNSPFGPNTETKFIQLTINGITREEAQHYLDDWIVDFRHEIVAQNASGWRIRVEVDPVYVSASDQGKAELKPAMQSFVTRTGTRWEECKVVGFNASAMTIDIPKGGPWQTAKGLTEASYLAALKADFSDIFRATFRIDRYYFAEAAVDQAIANGRAMTVTKAQALANIVDRLAE